MGLFLTVDKISEKSVRNVTSHYRHTLKTHSSSYLTQRTYYCSNFVAIYSMPGSVASGTPCIISGVC